MRTLLFTLEYPPFKGGVANFYGNIEKHWSQFAAADLGVGPEDPDSKLRVLHNNDDSLLSKWLWPKWLPSIAILKRVVKNQGIEHIIVGQILPLGTVVYRFSKKNNIPYTVFLHGMDIVLAMKPGRKSLIAKKILMQAKNIICASNYTASLALGFIGEQYRDKIKVVHPGVSPEHVLDENKLESIKNKYNLGNKTVFFSCGRLVKRKGFANVAKAMPQVLKTCSDCHYFIAGDGPEKMSLLNYSMQGKNITFLGRIDDVEKNAWFSACDVFITPAYSSAHDFEGFGIVYLEANIAGKPVIGGRSGGVPEAIDDGVSGILVDPMSVDDIARAMIRLAQDRTLRQQLGRQGHDRALEWFNWERQVGRLYKIINS